MSSNCLACGKVLDTGYAPLDVFCRDCKDWDGYQYRRGLAEGIRRCREAVEKVSDKYPIVTLEDCAICVINECIAAIDAVKGE